jgi:hypothetical protein
VGDKLQQNGQGDGKNNMRMEGHKDRKRMNRRTTQDEE